VAVIEVKSNLTTGNNGGGELGKALDTIKQVKTLRREHHIKIGVTYPSGERVRKKIDRIHCFLVAFHGPTLETLKKRIVEYGILHELGLDQYAPDVTVILDRDYSLTLDNGVLYPPFNSAFVLKQTNSCICDLFSLLCAVIQTANSGDRTVGFRRYLQPLKDKEEGEEADEANSEE